ncbi:TonB-dependent receptor [candidate division KSB1 bacterium]|nr:TonB-dependent receptor [candidate division KSB1 bacterium]
MRKLLLAAAVAALAAAVLYACSFDNGLGLLQSKISGKIYFLGSEFRPSNVDEVRVVAASNFPPQGFGDVFFSEAIPFDRDSAAYEMPLPRNRYPAVAVLWKPRGEDWSFTSLLGFYGFRPPLSAQLLPVDLTEAQPVAENVNIFALWSFAQFDAHVEGEITFAGAWPEDTDVVLLGAFAAVPDLKNIVNSLVSLGGIDFAVPRFVEISRAVLEGPRPAVGQDSCDRLLSRRRRSHQAGPAHARAQRHDYGHQFRGRFRHPARRRTNRRRPVRPAGGRPCRQNHCLGFGLRPAGQQSESAAARFLRSNGSTSFMSTAFIFRHSLARPRLCALAVFFLFVIVNQGRPYGTITGQVRDAETGDALPGANVLIARTLLGASADANGRYQIAKVPAGSYTVSASLIGYSTQRLTIQVNDDSTLVLNLALRSSAIPFDQVIVTGSRQAEELHAAAHSVSVLASSEIRQRNRFRIDEALQSIPAVQLIGENVSVRGGTGYSLLGLGGSRVLMLIDDVPVLTSDLGRANWDLLPVTEIERVEVLKGAASVLYGSGGISGVVNVITREPAKTPQLSFRQSAGVYDDPAVPEWRWTGRTLYFTRSDVSYTNVLGRLGFRLAASRHTSTSDRDNGDFSRWYLSSKSVLQFRDNSNLRLFLTYNRDARGFSLFWKEQNRALSTDFHDRINVDGFAASAVYNKLVNPVLAMKARLSYNAQLIGLPFNLSKDFKPALGWSGELQGNWLPHINHNVTLGVDYRRDMVESKYYGEHQASSLSPYVQETWKLSGVWQLSVGARYDHYVLVGDSAETQISPKLGFSFTPLPNTILHASVGRGFRAPSIAERFSESQPGDNVRLFSNPVLKPAPELR